jgi:outer membrane protein
MKFLRLNVFSLISLLIGVFLLLYFFAYANNRIVYVDSGKLLGGYKSMIEARKEFDKKQSVWQANIDTLTRDVQKAIKDYSKTSALGTDKEKQLAKELISSKQKELYDYQNAIKQNAGDEEQRLSQSVLATINAYLLRYGKKQGYKMILVAANGNIAYADDAVDITDKVIEDLNREYSPSAK